MPHFLRLKVVFLTLQIYGLLTSFIMPSIKPGCTSFQFVWNVRVFKTVFIWYCDFSGIVLLSLAFRLWHMCKKTCLRQVFLPPSLIPCLRQVYTIIPDTLALLYNAFSKENHSIISKKSKSAILVGGRRFSAKSILN